MKKLLLPLMLTAMFFTGMNAAAQAQQSLQPISAVQSQSKKLNINTASVTELKSLPGIGTAKADAIVNYRKQHGEFSSIHELSKVKGIGDKMVAKLSAEIDVR